MLQQYFGLFFQAWRIFVGALRPVNRMLPLELPSGEQPGRRPAQPFCRTAGAGAGGPLEVESVCGSSLLHRKAGTRNRKLD
jgi:hypothetical protein